MIYLLDTNICIYALKNSVKHLTDKLLKTPTKSIKIPSMVTAELLYGVEKSANYEKNMSIYKAFLSIYEMVPFDEKAAEHYAQIRADLERKGNVIGNNDIIIAATALANNGIVVSNNISEFKRVNGLHVEDWTL